MSFNLYIMRHAKSDWSKGETDFDRPLNKRGQKNAARMGQWLVNNKHVPAQVLCSSALRAKQTLEIVLQSFQSFSNDAITLDRELYLADMDTLLEKILLYRHAANSLLLVAHNPGLDYLIDMLSKNGLPRNADGKLMTTAALALFEYSSADFKPGIDKPETMKLIRPRELD